MINCKIDIDHAIGFVMAKGSEFDKARLLYLLEGTPPPHSLLRPLFDLQGEDGGFPSRPRPGNVSSIDSTLTAIWKLDESGLFDGPQARRALDFLAAMQQEDGSWDENPALPERDMAPWIRPGEMATRLYLTAYAAFWLGLSELQGSAAFANAIHFLEGQQQPDGQMPGFQHNSWLATGAFLLAGSLAADRGLRFLTEQALEGWEDSQLAWALDSLTQAGLPPGDPWVQTALAHLCDRQTGEGNWASEDGPVFAVSATLQVVKVLKRVEDS